jgi:hypothetical protein
MPDDEAAAIVSGMIKHYDYLEAYPPFSRMGTKGCPRGAAHPASGAARPTRRPAC